MTSRQRNFNIKSKERGITLITLVITIIVLLILAGVTLSGIFDKGIIKNTKNAKENAEILEEKETIQMAILFAKQASQTGDITLSDIENAMKRVVDGSRAAVVEDTDYTYIRFNDSNRHYTINNAEEIAGPVEIEGVPNAGDLTKGGKQNGTEEKPYIINCIEDLVAFSIMSNGGKEESTFTNKYVILARTLNFKAVSSYNDYSTKEYGDLNGDGTVEDIKTELTKQGDTCKGFTPIASFKGTFDGQNNKICNLYENRGTSSAGLFVSNSGTIQNLGLENITLTGGGNIGGIAAYSNGNIYKCFVQGHTQIKGSGYIGIIDGYCSRGSIKECYSEGTINLEATSGDFGGIVGNLDLNASIIKCYNIMEIKTANVGVGGIAGRGQSGTIDQCFHVGDITGYGILRTSVVNFFVKIINSYCIAEKHYGLTAGNSSDLFNCYSVGKLRSDTYKNTLVGMNYGSHIVHSFARNGDAGILSEENLTDDSKILMYLSSYNNSGYGHGANAKFGYKCGVKSDEEMKMQEFVDELNILMEVDANGEVKTTPEQGVWKKDENNINNGYPIFIWQEETENTD